MPINREVLLSRARDGAARAYAPFSKFRVGAAVVADGEVYVGCNVENASLGLTICAERNAIFQAIAAGHRRIEAVAVACVDADADAGAAQLVPCGACRQVIAEFAGSSVSIHVDRVGTLTLEDLLPNPFRL